MLRAAKAAGVNLHVLIDNRSVANGFWSITQGKLPNPPFAFMLWQDVHHLAAGMQHTCQWVPAHGRHLDWQPSGIHGISDPIVRRHLNDAADSPASAEAKEHQQLEIATFNELSGKATTWSAAALQRCVDGSTHLLQSNTALARFSSRWLA